MLYGEIGIDLFAGPTEVLIVADEDASPFMCAVDLLSQAEHGPDTPAVLVTNSERVGKETIEHVEKILTTTNMSTAGLASTSWKAFGEVVVTESIDEAYKVADTYASEHVQILTKSPRDALTKMSNYGALFLGAKTCVSYGDKVSEDLLNRVYRQAFCSKADDRGWHNTTSLCPLQVIGTNHVLPTKGAARYTGGLCVQKFLKTYTYQEVKTEEASGALGRLCGRAARAENFEGHARSGDLRASLFAKDQIDWIYTRE